MERVQDGASDGTEYDEFGLSDEEYDPVAAAAEDAEAIRRVVESPDVDPEFKESVLEFAAGRKADLEELGNHEAAAQYEIAV